MDNMTRREWAIKQTGTALPKYQDLTTFLRSHVRGLQAAEGNGILNKEKSKERHVKAHMVASQAGCVLCDGKHPLYLCPDVKQKSVVEMKQLVGKHRLCYNCLGKHMIKSCTWRGSCRKCGKRHHTLLHSDQVSRVEVAPTSGQPTADSGVQKAQQPVVSTNHVNVKTNAVLMTAIVNVRDSHGMMQPCRLFIDGGSEVEFISECCQRLGLRRRSAQVAVKGFGDTNVGRSRGKVETTLCSRFNEENSLTVDLYVLSKLTGMMPSFKCKGGKWRHLQGLQLADPEWYNPAAVDIVIGVRHYHKIKLQGRCQVMDDSSPVAWETIFGWVVSGSCPSDGNRLKIFHVSLDPVEKIVKRFWEIEEIPATRILSKEEAECEQHFMETHTRDKDGRFVLAVPFNDKVGDLGKTRDAAVQRYYQVERRKERNEVYKNQYNGFMQEYKDLGHMEVIPELECDEKVGEMAYLPHHGVLNESSTTTKLRVVFDGSAVSSSGLSLNDTMMCGPTVQEDLYDILLRFRTFPVVLKADIKQMFRQFLLREIDTNYHRIVWRDSPDEPVLDYRLKTVTYGTVYAPYLATRALVQLARTIAEKYPAAAKALLKSTYVDDILDGTENAENAIELYKELTEAVATAKLELRKWATNDPDVYAAIPEQLRESEPLSFEDDQSVKTLGVQWHPRSDVFKFKAVDFKDHDVLTKRKLLSDAARVFDPLGLISCVSIRAKMLLQDLWKMKCDWDDEVPVAVQQQWKEYKEDLKELANLSIPRRIRLRPGRYEIHGFSDSSERGLGALIYIRSFLEDGSISVSFVTSKTKVAPVQLVSLPRLELEAALMLAKLAQRVIQSLELNEDLYLWTDSTITCVWIRAPPHKWKTYIGNRVAKIQNLTSVDCWRHVPGVDNPADLASRGAKATELLNNDFWWKGPKWLSEPGLPSFTDIEQKADVDLEERKVAVHRVELHTEFIERFSSLLRLQRVTGYIFRFIALLKEKNKHRSKGPSEEKISVPLTATELRSALHFWIIRIQQQYYHEEIDSLKRSGRVGARSKLASLYPFIDQMGILRVSGRLKKASQLENRRQQIILPGKSHIVDLLVSSTHAQLLHGGFQLTWARLQSEYWIVGGRDRVRHFIRQCVACRRYRGRVAEQLMRGLPQPRVTASRAFLHTGVDYAGPFILRNPVGRAPKTYKGYMCLFICMATKAIHLEPVSSLSTEAFIDALRRFVSRRGLCTDIYSDCGSNFSGADRELRNLLKKKSTNNAIADDLSGRGVEWHFNPPYAPHHGGLWEAGVKSAKHHLRRVVGHGLMTYEQFHTILCQVEAVLNSRPLYALSPDPADLEALTPGHFLIGEALTAVPSANLEDIPVNRLTQFQLQQRRVQHFWRRWSAEYLSTLQQRNKWRWESDNVNVGDLMLIVEETSPGSWRMGRVVEANPGQDKLVRVVTLKTVSGLNQKDAAMYDAYDYPLAATVNADCRL